MATQQKNAHTTAQPSLDPAPAASQSTPPNAPKPASRTRRKALRIHGTIARDLGVAIVSGQYRPGEILDGEIAASDNLNVSRGAYREAVRILAAKGLVESKPKVGTRVSRPDQWHLLDPDVLGWIFNSEPSDALLSSLFELRRIIEPHAARLAAERKTQDDLNEMATALAGMAEHTLATEAGRIADQNFHSALLRATHNAFVISIASGIGTAVSWTTHFKQRLGPIVRDPLPDHQAVYDAIAASQPDAAQRAMEHLVDSARRDIRSARE